MFILLLIVLFEHFNNVFIVLLTLWWAKQTWWSFGLNKCEVPTICIKWWMASTMLVGVLWISYLVNQQPKIHLLSFISWGISLLYVYFFNSNPQFSSKRECRFISTIAKLTAEMKCRCALAFKEVAKVVT